MAPPDRGRRDGLVRKRVVTNLVAAVLLVGAPLVIAVVLLFAPVSAQFRDPDVERFELVQVDCGRTLPAYLHRTEESMRYPEQCRESASGPFGVGVILLGLAVVQVFFARKEHDWIRERFSRRR